MISLVVATVSRVDELDRLLNSLEKQSLSNFEVIVVDQNQDDRLLPILKRHANLQTVHLRSPLGASRARNVGIRAVQGDIIAIPDDDCWYAEELLASVDEWLASHPDFDVLFTGMRNQYGQLMLPKLPPPPGPCTRERIWDCSVVWSGFFRRSVVEAIGEFDETLGPGSDTIVKACEDSDYCIRPLDFGFKVWFEPSLAVYHPDLQATERLRRNIYPYAIAQGYIARRHGFSRYYIMTQVVRSLAGAAAALAKADLTRTGLYLLRAAGQFQGYFWAARDIRHSSTRSR
jgi:glycosyltransferase involved in cell wall biosynthesis